MTAIDRQPEPVDRDPGVPLPALPPSRSISASVYETLRQAIVDGSVPPGYRLREVWLARDFGVSTTPVREALRRLEREGLVEINPHRGAAVAAFDERAARNLYELRELLEVAAIRNAAQASNPDFSKAERLMDEIAATLDDPDQTQFNRLDVEFHRAINELGHNDVLTDMAERVHRQIQSIRARTAANLAGRPAVSHAEHQAILASLRSGDADEADRLMRLHIRGVQERALAALRSQERAVADSKHSPQ